MLYVLHILTSYHRRLPLVEDSKAAWHVKSARNLRAQSHTTGGAAFISASLRVLL